MLRSMSVSSPKTGRAVEFERDFGGTTVAEKISVYSDKVVADIFDQMATIKCAGVVRAALGVRDEAGNFKYTDEQCIQKGMEYVPIAGAERKPKDIYAGIVAKMATGTVTKDEVIRELKARLALLEK